MFLIAYHTESGVALGRRTEHRVVPFRSFATLFDDARGLSVEHDAGGTPLDEQEIAFAPCVPAGKKILCGGLNYRRHAEESGAAIPTVPVLFSKFSSSLAAHGEDVPLPGVAEQYDYEVELGVVIGRRAKDVTVESALDYVLGYCAANDLSARDLQMRTSQWLLGKTLDRLLPVGPLSGNGR